jgi:H+-transporting ATPase
MSANDKHSIDSQQVESLTIEEVTRRLESSDKGLSTTEAEKRLGEFGRNTLEEKKVSPLTRFLGYFWGPIPWMIEVAAILSGVVRHWDDFVIILVLLVFNAVVGFWQEFKAANALEALKHQRRAMAGNRCRGTRARRRHPPAAG